MADKIFLSGINYSSEVLNASVIGDKLALQKQKKVH